MATKKFGGLKTSATRLCGVLLAVVMVFGMCSVFAAPVEAAEGSMTDAPQYINSSITTTIRNLGKEEANKYVLLFSNGNANRIDGTNSVTGYSGSLDASTPKLKKTLSASGYPQLVYNDRKEDIATMNSKYGSNTLEDIFNASSASGTATKTYTADNTPFNYNEATQRFSLNSANNHVYFNESTNKFQIYEEPLRPYNITTSYGYDTFGAFLPFNSIEGTMKITDASGNKLSDVPEDVDYNADAAHAANLHITPKSGTNMADNWFVMKVDFSFYIPKDGKINGEDMVFEFSGDDDVWVYLDDVLVVDQGGTHKHTHSSINFASGVVEYQHYFEEGQTKPTDENSRDYKDWPWPWTETTIKKCFEAAAAETGDNSYSAAKNFKDNTLADYSIHTLTFFFMERGGEASNCKLDFNLPIVPKGALSVQKTLDGVATEAAVNQEYTFILRDDEGNALSNTDFSVIKTDGTLADGHTDGNGQFKLMANERAVFEKIEGGENYSVVQITEKDDEVYQDYSSDTSCTINGNDSGSESEDGYSTGNFEVKYDKDNQTDIVFTNVLKQDKAVTVTKDTGDYISADQTFTFKAQIETMADQTFTLKSGESKTFSDIPAGAKVVITETVPEGMLASNKLSSDTEYTSGSVHTVAELVDETTINFYNELKMYELVVSKAIDGSLGNKAKEFDFEITAECNGEDVLLSATDCTYDNGVLSFALANDESVTVANIPYGAKVVVSEDKEDYTATVSSGNYSAEGTSYSIDKMTDDVSVDFLNVKNGAPDTGISLDSLPYVIILVLVLAGAAVFYVRRRRIDCEQ